MCDDLPKASWVDFSRVSILIGSQEIKAVIAPLGLSCALLRDETKRLVKPFPGDATSRQQGLFGLASQVPGYWMRSKSALPVLGQSLKHTDCRPYRHVLPHSIPGNDLIQLSESSR